jgi:class 3 adenylate cyclase
VAQAAPVVVVSPQFGLQSGSETRPGAVLIVDIAGTVGLRSQFGDTAAGRRIRALLETIIDTAQRHGGEFIKSYGDDVMAIFEREPLPSAARVAMLAQQQAEEAGLQLYAGLHAGDVEFRQTMGHPDALGLTVNFAARLHKLTEGAPGRIFLTEESVAALPPELRERANRYGTRELKGIGAVHICTLDWKEAITATETVFRVTGEVSPPRPLLLRHAGRELRLAPGTGSCLVGRGKDCALRVPDAEPRVSSTHLLFEYASGRWFVQDISRNGSWVRDARGEVTRLPHCKQVMLSGAGSLCLGRDFADDPQEQFTLVFEIGEAP